MVRLLLQYVPTACGGPNGKTALHAAVCRSYDIAKMLLVKKPELNRQVDTSSSTPLHYAASHGDLQMVQLLLQLDPSIAHLSDTDGLSPIHVSASMGHIDVIRMLIQMCPDSFELVDKRGRNFLHVAVEKKRPEVVKYVLKIPLLNELINEPDYDGNTPLHLATINCNQEIVHILLAKANTRVATDTTNYKGLTPLDHASSCVGSFIGLRMNKIRGDLVWAGSQFSPQRLDLVSNNIRRNQEEEVNRCRAIANNLAIVAVLIATVSFAAAFTLPGGYQSDAGTDQGMAILAKKAAFKAFLISDALAMVSSIIITCLLIHTGSVDHDVRLHSLRTSVKLMWVAIGGMVVAFATGTYVVVASDCKWLAILICVMVCSVPFVVWMISCWPAFESFEIAKVDKNQNKKACSLKAKQSHWKNFLIRFTTSRLYTSITDVQTPALSIASGPQR